jgi:hypothetical protein
VIRHLADNSPDLAPFLWPLVYAYAAFVLLTWLSPSFFNLLLRLDRFGRYALSADQVRGANLLAGCLLLTLGCLIAYVWVGGELLMLCTIFFVALALPASAIYVCDAGWPRHLMAVITAGLLAALLLAIACFGLAFQLRSVPLLNISLQIIQALPLASLASQFAAIYLTQVTVRN